MKIILIKDVLGLGKKFDVKKVKPGYSRNFLLPKKLAIPASKKNLKWLEREKFKEEEKNKEILKNLEEILEKIKKTKLKIYIKTGIKGELFEKITEAKIAKAFQNEKIKIKKDNILLKNPISKPGEYEIDVKLEGNVQGKAKIKVLREKEKKLLKKTIKKTAKK